MTPVEIIYKWVELFNASNAEGLGYLYSEDAINHQVANEEVYGRQNIIQMFENEFAQADMVCIIEQIIDAGDWVILEWKDPLGLRGCGIFYIKEGLIHFQRGYWDKLSFLKMHGLPVI